MDHPEKCPLCDQEQENLDHMLIGCVFTREFWFKLLSQVNIQNLAPQLGDGAFMEWWHEIGRQVQGVAHEGLNSLIILGASSLRKHHNGCVLTEKGLTLILFIDRLIRKGSCGRWLEQKNCPC
jgi:hypothetical protein